MQSFGARILLPVVTYRHPAHTCFNAQRPWHGCARASNTVHIQRMSLQRFCSLRSRCL